MDILETVNEDKKKKINEQHTHHLNDKNSELTFIVQQLIKLQNIVTCCPIAYK